MLLERQSPAPAEEPWDQKEMPFTEHLRELRGRLFICVGTIFAIAVLALWPAQKLIPWITKEYFNGIQLNAFGPADAVWAIFKLALYIAVIIGLPVILYQTWMFVVPAIHPKTRQAVYIYVAPSIFLAAGGLVAATVFFGIFSGVFIALPPVCFVALTEDKSKIGTRIGMGMAIFALGTLTGGPGGGAILQMNPKHLDWTGMWAFGGACIMAAVLVYIAVRVMKKI